ncbi:flagellar hook-basal body complex protein FliE [Sporosarcina sp. 179-K 3D1 HS]|uniref:flagellar hook-basal body complex protein FliE n=1 Tax=Sporosarcina sp. 179-K 3D1 HS TaxID=3232169 RepID=UPI0039A39C47
MAIQPLSIIRPATGQMTIESGVQPTPYEAQQSFGNFLKAAMNDVNKKQIESDKMTQKLVLGGDVELHDVMIAAQKASIALNATMEVRNKVVEAYQEIIRMPV